MMKACGSPCDSGAPMIYYGDEAGMWGANAPCCRKPMLWPELDFEPELYLPDGGIRETSTPTQFNHALFNHYKHGQLILEVSARWGTILREVTP